MASGVGWHDPLHPATPPGAGPEEEMLAHLHGAIPLSTELRPVESCATISAEIDDAGELPSCATDNDLARLDEHLIESDGSCGGVRQQGQRMGLRARLPRNTKSVDSLGTVGGRTGGTAASSQQRRMMSPKQQLLRREEWGKAMRRDVELKGLDTGKANQVLNESIKKHHTYLGEIIRQDRSLAPVLCRYLLQPQVILLLCVLAGLILGVVLEPPTHLGSDVLIVELCISVLLIALFATQDIVIMVRRSRDLYKKLSRVVESDACRFDGHMEGLAGLRGVDSCKVVSVLRNSDEDVHVSLTKKAVVALEQWRVSESHKGCVSSKAELVTKSIDSLRAPTEEAEKVRLSMEVSMSHTACRPKIVQAVVSTRNLKVKIKGSIAEALNKAIGEDFKEGEWYRIAVEAEVDLKFSPSQAGTLTVYMPEPGEGVGPSNVRLQNIVVSHQLWRWTSFPRALCIPHCDVAMDTGVMRIFNVKKDFLAACLYSAFFLKNPKHEDNTRNEALRVKSGYSSGPYMSICLAPSQTAVSSPGVLGDTAAHASAQAYRADAAAVAAMAAHGKSGVPAGASASDGHVFSPIQSQTPVTEHTSTPEVTESPFLSPTRTQDPPPATQQRSTETRRGAHHARTDSTGYNLDAVPEVNSDDQASVGVAPPPPLGEPDSSICNDNDGSSSTSSESEEAAQDPHADAAHTPNNQFPTNAQHRFFLVQRLLSIFTVFLVVVLVVVRAVQIGRMKHLSVYEMFIHPVVGIAFACLPINSAVVLRVVDMYANACLRSMIQMQDTSLKIVAAEGARERGHVYEYDDDESLSGFSSLLSSASTRYSEDERVGGGDIFGAREDGQLVFGAYNENLSGRKPPPPGEASGFHLETLAHPSITRAMIFYHMKAILFDDAYGGIPAPPADHDDRQSGFAVDAAGKLRARDQRRICYGGYDLVHSRNVCQVLGSLTILACVDKTGVLSEVVPVPEKVLVMKRKAAPPTDKAGGAGTASKDRGGEDGGATVQEDGAVRPAGDAAVCVDVDRQGGSELGSVQSLGGPAQGDEVQQLEGSCLLGCTAGSGGGDAGNTMKEQMATSNFAQRQYHEMTFLTLNVCSNSAAENLLQFADPEWTKYLPQLKPLGLTASLHCLQCLEEEVKGNVNQRVQPQKRHHGGGRRHRNRANRDHAQQSHHMREQLHFDDTILWGKYLYFLGKEIGFSEGLLRAAGYKVKKRIHTLRPQESYRNTGEKPQYSNAANYDQTLDGRQQMASLVVIDGQGKWQLLSIGAPQFILQYTSDYWNGEDVLPLTGTDRKELFYTSNEWRRQRDLTTVAFSYKPLPERYHEFLKEDCVGDAIHILEAGAGGGRRRGAAKRSSSANVNTDENDTDFDGFATDSSFLEDEAGDPPFEGMSHEQVYQRIQQKQIFIGMVGSREPPKETVQNSITAFKEAGIRFIHFNPGNERMTKAFGEKLGLWTTANDWNCCISLTEKTQGMEYAAIKARLPMGIKQIREHLVRTDNVPLLVPLFCESKPRAARSMIQILQEYDEVVGVCGSMINHTNTRLFRQADLGIAVTPTCNTKLMHENRALTASHFSLFGLPGCPIGKEVLQSQKIHHSFATTKNNLLSLGHLVSLPCAVRLTPTEFPLYFILCLIKHARLQQHCILRVVEIVISCSVSWGLLFFLCGVMALPPILSVSNLLFQLFAFTPLLAVALYEPFESLLCARIMKTHPSKNSQDEHIRVMKHLIVLWFQRFLLTTIVIGVVYVWTLCHVLDVGIGDVLPASEARRDEADYFPSVEYAQHVTMVSAAIFFASHGVGSLSRHLPVKLLHFHSGIGDDGSLKRCRVALASYRRKTGADYFNPIEFPRCLTLLAVSVVVQVLYSVLCLSLIPANDAVDVGSHPKYLYILVFGYAVLILVLDNANKPRRKERYKNRQLIRSLHFDTRLGMHSPRGDDKGDEDKGALKEAKQREDTYWDILKFYSL